MKRVRYKCDKCGAEHYEWIDAEAPQDDPELRERTRPATHPRRRARQPLGPARSLIPHHANTVRILCNLPLECFDEREALQDVELVTYGPPAMNAKEKLRASKSAWRIDIKVLKDSDFPEGTFDGKPLLTPVI